MPRRRDSDHHKSKKDDETASTGLGDLVRRFTDSSLETAIVAGGVLALMAGKDAITEELKSHQPKKRSSRQGTGWSEHRGDQSSRSYHRNLKEYTGKRGSPPPPGRSAADDDDEDEYSDANDEIIDPAPTDRSSRPRSGFTSANNTKTRSSEGANAGGSGRLLLTMGEDAAIRAAEAGQSTALVPYSSGTTGSSRVARSLGLIRTPKPGSSTGRKFCDVWSPGDKHAAGRQCATCGTPTKGSTVKSTEKLVGRMYVAGRGKKIYATCDSCAVNQGLADWESDGPSARST